MSCGERSPEKVQDEEHAVLAVTSSRAARAQVSSLLIHYLQLVLPTAASCLAGGAGLSLQS